MCINNDVGKNSTNNIVDVKVIQAALNLAQNNNFKLTQKLIIDGKIGKKTISTIETFQNTIVGMGTPDGIVSVNGKTIKILRSSVKKGLNIDSLSAIMAHGSNSNIRIYLPLLQTQLAKYDISSPLRIAHLLAQLGHESLSLTYTEELASGEAYEGRKDLGNTETGDGKRFKGRGLIQLTGRANYAAYSKDSGLGLLKTGNEILISKNPEYALDVSLWFWKKNNLNKRADMDDLRGITKRVNGGYNGLEDRANYLCRAKFFLI